MGIFQKTKEECKMPRNRRRTAAVFAAIIFSFVLGNLAHAQMSCADLKYGKPDYNQKMDVLAKRAKLPDNYWSRYHESVVSYLCSGNIKGIDMLIDNGFLNSQEAQNIAQVLGKEYKAKDRSQTGKSYGYSKEKFLEMGACNACADNIAQYYTRKPNSPCGVLAKQALSGNPDAIRKMVEFPDYCQWKY